MDNRLLRRVPVCACGVRTMSIILPHSQGHKAFISDRQRLLLILLYDKVMPAQLTSINCIY